MNTDDLDIIIIGAGLSGIGAACHLKRECPHKRFIILEGRDAMGGTWDLFRYPGVRSDSDMYTLGYNFKPWTKAKGIADGSDILNYIKDAADEHSITSHIHFNHWVSSADWSDKTGLWSLTIDDKASGEQKIYRCKFMICCAGYYNYDHGYQPEFPGMNDFGGDFIHPQKWPENYDYSNKKVVVIGSGATAITLVPAMANKAAHVCMLQRSPTYVASIPQNDPMVNGMRKLLPEKWVYRLTRMRNVYLTSLMYYFCKAFPYTARKLLKARIRKQLGNDFDMTHFSPDYNPWDERLCAVPDGDLFTAIKSGKVSIVTDHIDHFDTGGIRLKSGQYLNADIIISATGLDVQMFGKMSLTLNGKPFEQRDKMVYRGVLLEGLPNAGFVFGYTNSSWTLKADLIIQWMCRLLKFMDKQQQGIVVPRNEDTSIEHRPFVDMRSGYIQRALDMSPKQGSKIPWKLYQNYWLDFLMLHFGRVNDRNLAFSNPTDPDGHDKSTSK